MVTSTTERTSFDYIIAGGGHAGCVVASRLSQYLPDCSIALVEVGEDAHDNPMVQSALRSPELHGTPLQWNDMTTPQPGADGRQIYHGGGKLLSGGTGANYGSWVRGHDVDFDEWAKLVDDNRWSYKGLLPYFRRIETHYKKREECDNPEEHGFDGPIHTIPTPKYPLGPTLLEALMEAGHKELADANSGQPLGVARTIENWKKTSNGYVRQPAGQAYDLSRVHVITSTLIHKVIFEKRPDTNKLKAVGIDIGDGRKLLASKEVIVCCGSLRTPQLLMLSGLGPKSHLESHHIEPLLDIPDLGGNLHDHCAVMLYWQVKHPEKGLALGHPNFDPQGMAPLEWVFTGTIPPSILVPALQADKVPDPSVHPNVTRPRAHYETIFCYFCPGLQPDQIPADVSVISTGIANWLPTSRGTIRLGSPNPAHPPLIDPQYLTTQHDMAILRGGIRDMFKVMSTSAARKEIEGPFQFPGTCVDLDSSDEAIDDRIRKTIMTWFHPGGTAAMGKVVDTNCAVNGVECLRVVDASIFPLPLGAHYQAPVYAMAELAAEIIAGVV